MNEKQQLEVVVETEPTFDDPKFDEIQKRVRREQDFKGAWIAGLVAALVGAGLWIVTTIATGLEFAWMAIPVGYLVGIAIREAGAGIDRKFGLTGVVLTLLGCGIGKGVSAFIWISANFGFGYVEIMDFVTQKGMNGLGMLLLTPIIASYPVDLLFYLVALVLGYKLSNSQLMTREMARRISDLDPSPPEMASRRIPNRVRLFGILLVAGSAILFFDRWMNTDSVGMLLLRNNLESLVSYLVAPLLLLVPLFLGYKMSFSWLTSQEMATRITDLDTSAPNMARRRIPKGVRLAGISVVAGAAILFFISLMNTGSVTALVFEGSSEDLASTRVVPTLDTAIEKGHNAVWCASFLSAWKVVEEDVLGEPPSVEGDPQIALALNRAPDPRPHIPEESLYVAAGFSDEGIIEKIRREMASKFPSRELPSFSGLVPNSLVAYAYLEASVKFSIPYLQGSDPLYFTDSSGESTAVNSFGIPPKNLAASRKLHKQPAVLFRTGRPRSRSAEFAIDLDSTSEPHQVIVAIVEPKATMAEMIGSVEEKIAEAEITRPRELGISDVLLVPEMAWRLSHRFQELEGKVFTNSKLNHQPIAQAVQDIEFRLDRYGAEVKSHAQMLAKGGGSPPYIFDRPFLLYMKKRGADTPYFAMWVDNPELLSKWQPE